MSNSPEPTSDNVVGGQSGVGKTIRLFVSAIHLFAWIFFVGFMTAWFKSEGELTALIVRGLKFGLSGSAGILTAAGIAALMKRPKVPEYVRSMTAFAAGFFVFNGLEEILDGRFGTALAHAGGGFCGGLAAGFGVYWAQKKGWGTVQKSRSKS